MNASPYGIGDGGGNNFTVVNHNIHINIHGDQNKTGILQANKTQSSEEIQQSRFCKH